MPHRRLTIVWDNKFINAVAKNTSNLKTYAIQDLGIAIPVDILEDMGTITVGNGQTRLTEAAHPFVKAAMDWRREQAKRQKLTTTEGNATHIWPL